MGTLNLTIRRGETFRHSMRWQSGPEIYKAITAMPSVAPVRFSSAGHGILDDWPVAVIGLVGPDDINAKSDPPKARDYRPVRIIDENTVEFNGLSAVDMPAYVSGGYLRFNSPVPLAGYEARMQIKNKVGGTELLLLTTDNGGIEIDADNCRIDIVISDSALSAATWKSAVYDLEMVSPAGIVKCLVSGSVTLTDEVTTHE